MLFYAFHQNNSGGKYKYPAQYVIIEAVDVEIANDIAETFGIYFYGASGGVDCNCCGDRWNPCYKDGTNVPQVNDTLLEDWLLKCSNDKKIPLVLVIYANGQIQEYINSTNKNIYENREEYIKNSHLSP